MAQKQNLKERIARREPLLGMLNFSGSEKLIELVGITGFDYIIIDTEHTTTSWEACERMVIMARAVGLPALIRVGIIDEHSILRALDCGADGIVVPHVSTAETAERAVQFAKYPPRGNRGMCPGIRPTGYGGMPWQEHAAAANRDTVVICLIEDVTGLENIEAICKVADIDAIWCGTGDLSQSMGIPHSGLDHPRMAAAMTRIRDVCKANGRSFMATAGSSPNPDYVRRLWDFGANIVSMAPDMMLIRNHFASIVAGLRNS